ncbi:MAG: hypothetical protein ACRDV9_09240 [Acidimicrobiia bacterium]
MNTALACPICGHQHRLSPRSTVEATFRCESCSTLLRVPDGVAPTGAPSRGTTPPTALPVSTAASDSHGSVGFRRGLAWPLRALIWAAALPVGLATTVIVLRRIGLLGVDDVVDLFLGAGPGRFTWVAVLVPLWAALTAVLAHFPIEALSRRIESRRSRVGSEIEAAQPSAHRRGSQSTRP